MRAGPIPDSYWVEDEKFLAGEYPSSRDEAAAREKLETISAAGVDTLLDLTEPDEHGLEPYDAHLVGLEYRRMPILDLGCPTGAQMRAILDAIDEALERTRTVYVLCWGGIGRTGTVVGCWLVRHGTTADKALELIAARRRDTPDGYRVSPETAEQRDFVQRWQNDE